MAPGTPDFLLAGWSLLRGQFAEPVLESEIQGGPRMHLPSETALAPAIRATSGVQIKSVPSPCTIMSLAEKLFKNFFYLTPFFTVSSNITTKSFSSNVTIFTFINSPRVSVSV